MRIPRSAYKFGPEYDFFTTPDFHGGQVGALPSGAPAVVSQLYVPDLSGLTGWTVVNVYETAKLKRHIRLGR